MMASFTWVLSTLLLLLFDVGYFVRIICHAIIAKLLAAIKIGKRQPMAEGKVWGKCYILNLSHSCNVQHVTLVPHMNISLDFRVSQFRFDSYTTSYVNIYINRNLFCCHTPV